MKYCSAVDRTIRWKTKEVKVGSIGVGGANPVRIQSMTTSSTRDVGSTVDQIMKLADVGCEIARVTVQGMKEADACEEIKNLLIKKGYTIPLVADIHFYPPAAMRVVDFVDKVRINPGNFVDKRASFKLIEYTDATYAEELLKIKEKFIPLINKCKRLKRAMRIGTNHGSLSDRIMNRYGDNPRGMLESALEFARICRENDYHDFIFSMKSSNPQVMVHSYRLLVAEMIKLNWDYPLHLGVTEAGLGEDGRVKSAMGIGALLLDGIGDTIRVSLTEDAWKEIEPCKRLVKFGEYYQNLTPGVSFSEKYRHFDDLERRKVSFHQSLGMHRDGTVMVSASDEMLTSEGLFKQIGYDFVAGKPKINALSIDSIVLESACLSSASKDVVKLLMAGGCGVLSANSSENKEITPICSLEEAEKNKTQRMSKDRFTLKLASQSTTRTPLVVKVTDNEEHKWEVLKELSPDLILLAPVNDRLHACRHFFEWLKGSTLKTPVILNFTYAGSKEDTVIHAAAECGSLLCDGLGDGVWLDGAYEPEFYRKLGFAILQASRMRMSKTDFISCPSCGRTLFDLQDVTKRITTRTSHLPGVKIAIMGCIVNGPGEMADADFGYVGSQPGMIDLYVGKTRVEKDISFADADDRLIELIKANGRWVDV